MTAREEFLGTSDWLDEIAECGLAACHSVGQITVVRRINAEPEALKTYATMEAAAGAAHSDDCHYIVQRTSHGGVIGVIVWLSKHSYIRATYDAMLADAMLDGEDD